MIRILIFITFIIPITVNAQKNDWINNYWVSTNVSLLFGNDKLGTGFAVDVGRDFKHAVKAGIGLAYLQFDSYKNATIINFYLEKSISSDKRDLFFFAKPGIAIPNRPKDQASKISFYEYKNAKMGGNLQFGSGIRWKIKRHSYFISTGYNFTNYSFTTKQTIGIVNPLNPSLAENIIHNYRLSYSNILVNIGFGL
jgi:hypothetical protein